MKMTIDQLSEKLSEKFAGRKWDAVTRRNGTPSDGWAIVGHPGITRAIKDAGLPWARFWSGKAPTPSTQAPEEIIKYAKGIAL